MVGPQETAGESLGLTHAWARPSGIVAVRSGSRFSPASGEARILPASELAPLGTL